MKLFGEVVDVLSKLFGYPAYSQMAFRVTSLHGSLVGTLEKVLENEQGKWRHA